MSDEKATMNGCHHRCGRETCDGCRACGGRNGCPACSQPGTLSHHWAEPNDVVRWPPRRSAGRGMSVPIGHCARGLGCGSNSVTLLWVAMNSTDANSWECLACGRQWATPYHSVADARRNEWQAAALAAGWTPPSEEATVPAPEPDTFSTTKSARTSS